MITYTNGTEVEGTFVRGHLQGLAVYRFKSQQNMSNGECNTNTEYTMEEDELEKGVNNNDNNSNVKISFALYDRGYRVSWQESSLLQGHELIQWVKDALKQKSKLNARK